MGNRWPALPLGLQTLVCSYLTTFERELLSFWAPTPEDCVRYLSDPTSEWFSHNPDCTIPFLEWLMTCCRRYRCLYLGTRPVNIDFIVISQDFWFSSISVKLYSCEPELLVDEYSDDAKKPRVQVGKKNLERMCHVQGGIVHLQLPKRGSGPCYWESLSTYQCSNVWQGRYVLVFNYSEYCSLWCLTNSAAVRTIRCPSEVCCAYVVNDRRVYIGAEDGTVCIYDPVEDMMLDRAGIFVFGPWCEPKRVNHLLYLGPRRLLVGSEDSKQLVVVDTEERCRPVDILSGHDDCISCVYLNRDRTVLVSCDLGGGVRVWRVNGENLVLECHQQVNCNQLTCCAVSPDGSMVVVHSGKMSANFLLLRSDMYQPVFVPQPLLRIESLSFDPTGRYLACAYPSGVYLVDTDRLRNKVWVTRKCVPLPSPIYTSFLGSLRLFVFSTNARGFVSPTLHTIEW